MSEGLKRLSVVFTVLWLIASVFMWMYMFEEHMEDRFIADNYAVREASGRRAATVLSIIVWVGGTAAWWGLMYAGSWIARGFKEEQK